MQLLMDCTTNHPSQYSQSSKRVTPSIMTKAAVALCVYLSLTAVQAFVDNSQSAKTYIVEYIGAKGDTNPSPASILNELVSGSDNWMQGLGSSYKPVSAESGVQDVFNLGFARDDGQGNFMSYWEKSITSDVISNFKSRFPNAAFLASLGGATMPNPQGSGPAVNYNWPSQSGDCGDWISAATSSVSSLISSNNLDGIDVDFENELDDSFATCMNGLITNLRNNNQGNTIVSITPYGDQRPGLMGTGGRYAELYNTNADNIDIINYQAYASGFDSTSQYEDFYTNQVSPFPATKLLLGVETDGAPNRGQTGSDIAATFQDLYRKGLINGAMFFQAEDSYPLWTSENLIKPIMAP